MRKVVVVEYMSLDGVVQAPGDPTEDPKGFEHGGWTRPFFGDHRRYIAEAFRGAGAFLLGRVTYEIFAAYWPTVTAEGDDIAWALNHLPKYVASTTLGEARWPGTTCSRAMSSGRWPNSRSRPVRTSSPWAAPSWPRR